MDIKKIIEELIQNNIIGLEPIAYTPLTGGTVSNLYLLRDSNGTKLVVKMNNPHVIKSEAYFLNLYQDLKLLPDLLFVEPSNHYIVYSFISGSTNYTRNNKKEMLEALVKGLINHYRPAPNIGWGWADELTFSWKSFILNRMLETNEILYPYLEKEEIQFVLSLVETIMEEREPFFLHGDCGVHNFIFQDGKLCGVIDPTPVIGDPLYDLIYAFCSSPDDLTKETIDSASSHLVGKGDFNLYEEVMIGLYLRLGTCLKHHPNDFEEYLTAWHYWKNIVKNK
jgi:hypothetical protein